MKKWPDRLPSFFSQSDFEISHKELRDFLRDRTDVFLNLRSRYGLGVEAGFGSLPYGHEHTPGYSAPLSVLKGRLGLSALTDTGRSKFLPLDGKLAAYVIIKPEAAGSYPTLTSFTIPRYQYEVSPEDVMELVKSDEFLYGILAHELAHSAGPRLRESDLASEIRALMRKLRHEDERVRLESETDLVACAYGFGKAVLFALESWGDLQRRNQTLSPDSEDELNYRIEVIKKFGRQGFVGI